MMYLWIVLLALALFAIWYFLNSSNSNMSEEVDENPIDVLNRRLVNGEITEKEYEEKRKIISDN